MLSLWSSRMPCHTTTTAKEWRAWQRAIKPPRVVSHFPTISPFPPFSSLWSIFVCIKNTNVLFSIFSPIFFKQAGHDHDDNDGMKTLRKNLKRQNKNLNIICVIAKEDQVKNTLMIMMMQWPIEPASKIWSVQGCLQKLRNLVLQMLQNLQKNFQC